MRTPSLGSGHDRWKIMRKVVSAFRGVRKESDITRGSQTTGPVAQDAGAVGSLWVLAPLFIPLPKFGLVRRFNGLICRLHIAFWGWRLGFRDPVFINYVPVLAEAMRGFDGRMGTRDRRVGGYQNKRTGSRLKPMAPQKAPRVVYHCVDRWDQFSTYDSRMMTEMDRRCCAYADLVIASACELFDRCKAHNPNTVLIPHGVDWDHFRSAISANKERHRPVLFADRKNVQGDDLPVVGFFGLLSEWVDQALIVKLAQALPGVRVMLIGKADVDVALLRRIPNISLPGPKPFAELPSYVAGFTVGIIPFIVNDLTRAVNPIKLREMLAAGCPVVSTALPEVQRCASGCVAHTHEEFVAMVRGIIDTPLTIDQRIALSDSMRNETWSAKVDEMLALFLQGGRQPGDSLDR